MECVLVGLGGIFGSIVRFLFGKFISERANTNFPVGTIIINVSGAILLGIVSSLKINHNIYLITADGFLGAYTTFSTFMYEGFNLFQKNEKLNAFAYVFVSLILGVIGYVAGNELTKLF